MRGREEKRLEQSTIWIQKNEEEDKVKSRVRGKERKRTS
jgi:hypothetical protein